MFHVSNIDRLATKLKLVKNLRMDRNESIGILLVKLIPWFMMRECLMLFSQITSILNWFRVNSSHRHLLISLICLSLTFLKAFLLSSLWYTNLNLLNLFILTVLGGLYYCEIVLYVNSWICPFVDYQWLINGNLYLLAF